MGCSEASYQEPSHGGSEELSELQLEHFFGGGLVFWLVLSLVCEQITYCPHTFIKNLVSSIQRREKVGGGQVDEGEDEDLGDLGEEASEDEAHLGAGNFLYVVCLSSGYFSFFFHWHFWYIRVTFLSKKQSA